MSAEFNIAPSTPADAEASELVAHIVQIVNAAYTRGEQGMWKGECMRTNDAEMKVLLSESKILLLRRSSTVASDNAAGASFTTTSFLCGCIFVNASFGEALGELGMLCVSETCLGRGLGRLLVSSAELYCKKNGCKQMRLELLTPRAFVHPVKAWLDGWYQRLGYVKGVTEDFGAAYPRIAPLLACECNFTVYLKDL